MGARALGIPFQTHGIFIVPLCQYAEEDRSMPARPAWSGQIRISLVAFKVALSSALKRGSRIPLHEFDRKSGERIHHQNVTDDGTRVEREDIVKGFETGDDEALRELVNAKKAHRTPRLPKPGKTDAKVVNFMDALRKSLHARASKVNASHGPHRRRRSA
jgi:non-homologous end joining protein Ku